MSTMSSSKSNFGGKGRASDANSLYGEEGENPFKLPSDELIFSFKDLEKERKIIYVDRIFFPCLIHVRV